MSALTTDKKVQRRGQACCWPDLSEALAERTYESKMRSRFWDSDVPSLSEQINTSGPSSSTLAVTPTRSPAFASSDRVACACKHAVGPWVV